MKWILNIKWSCCHQGNVKYRKAFIFVLEKHLDGLENGRDFGQDFGSLAWRQIKKPFVVLHLGRSCSLRPLLILAPWTWGYHTWGSFTPIVNMLVTHCDDSPLPTKEFTYKMLVTKNDEVATLATDTNSMLDLILANI